MTSSISQAGIRRYAIDHWSEGYFDVGSDGRALVRPNADADTAQSLESVVATCRQAGLCTPLLLRFTDILSHRVESLTASFQRARKDQAYGGDYRLIYPIKVNQQRSVVEAFARMAPERIGLEAGSKAELLILLGVAPQGSTLICNGFKDRDFIRLALLGTAMGFDLHLILESAADVDLLIKEARHHPEPPIVGLRVRLSSIGSGKWQNTGGEHSKFGLSASELVAAAHRLEDAGLTQSIRLLHVHMGSQISHIRDLQQGMREVASFYTAIRQLGLPLDIVDVGGGLAVDYDGTQSREDCSANYEIDDYARVVVRALAEECDRNGWPHPDIFSESGRALTAHHAVLVTDVVKTERAPLTQLNEPAGEADDAAIRDLLQILQSLDRPAPLEVYHEAADLLAHAHDKFILGLLSLPEVARAEEIFNTICARLRSRIEPSSAALFQLKERIEERLADKVLCNMSVFRSLPDIWALQQVFPIVPLTGNATDTARASRIGDLTCDSDGRIDQYVSESGLTPFIQLPDAQPGDSPQLLGIFLVGAYQEVLGDIHNLFGTPDSASFRLESGKLTLDALTHGESVAQMHRATGFDSEALLARIRAHPGIGEGSFGKDIADSFSAASTYLSPDQSGGMPD